MKKFFKKLRVKALEFLTPEPEIQSDYVDKVVTLLRRDFTTAQQNEILFSVARKLSSLREQDMNELAQKYETIQKDNNTLNTSILC